MSIDLANEDPYRSFRRSLIHDARNNNSMAMGSARGAGSVSAEGLNTVGSKERRTREADFTSQQESDDYIKKQNESPKRKINS